MPFHDQEWVQGVTDYGLPYTAALWRGSVVATQFHPEKSQEMGIRMLRNFKDWVTGDAGV